MIPIITSLLARVDSLENVLNEITQEIIDLKNIAFDLEKRVNFQERYSSKGCLIFFEFSYQPILPQPDFRQVQPSLPLLWWICIITGSYQGMSSSSDAQGFW